MKLQTFFLTFAGAGLSPKYPATVGSLLALLVGFAVLYYFGIETLFLLTLGLVIVGIAEISKYEKETGTHDPKHIVVDEAAGMWLSLMVAISTANEMPYPYAIPLAAILSFMAFRLFDEWKPSTIGWIDREIKGGLGVMMDDVIAGIAGGFLTVLILMGMTKVF